MAPVVDQTLTALRCQLQEEPSAGRRCLWWIKCLKDPKVSGCSRLADRTKVLKCSFLSVTKHSMLWIRKVNSTVPWTSVTKKVITSAGPAFLLIILLQRTTMVKLTTRPLLIPNKESVWGGPTVNIAQMSLTGQIPLKNSKKWEKEKDLTSMVLKDLSSNFRNNTRHPFCPVNFKNSLRRTWVWLSIVLLCIRTTWVWLTIRRCLVLGGLLILTH